PMTLKQQGLQDQEDFGARLITAEVTTPEGTVFDFTTVYCPNGKTLEHADFGRKLEWYKSLNAYWQQNAAAKHLICGDFNIVPEAIDGWRGEQGEGTIFYTKEERQHLQDFVDLGLTDLFRNRYPDRQEFSWWDYRGGAFHRKHGLRIDFLLATQPLVDATTEVIIDRDYRRKIEDLTASDHAPVFADLNI
ncbi:MAG: exodeoxyribonuclease III, partial [Pseudomonadota bacterium]|nr:exodeoxyribonuclease III [Pseudomonadota bacterium]